MQQLSYSVAGEEQYIKDVWARYHDKYNVFYKGHPGHMDHPLFVTNWMNADKPESMYQLEPMISSEELTRDHVIPASGRVKGTKYIQFDKVISVGQSSAVTAAAFPNLDITKDVLEVYYGLDSKTHNMIIHKNPSMYPSSKNWAQEISWLTK